MKGWFVALLFIIINLIAFSSALFILGRNMQASILTAEENVRQSLVVLLDAHKEKNEASQKMLDAASLVPKVDRYTLSIFSNNMQKLNNITIGYNIIDRPVTFQEYQYIQSKIQESIRSVVRIANNYPDLRSNPYFMEARKEVQSSDKKVVLAVSNYNESINEYNRLTSRLPTSILAGFMRKFQLLRFETGGSVSEQVGLDFK